MADTNQSQAPASGEMTAHQRYESLKATRELYVLRGVEAAKVTVPAVMPYPGKRTIENLPTPWQSVGARGVLHLASKLLLALFPPGTSFFRLTLDDFVLQQLEAKTGQGESAADARADFELALGKVERAVSNRMEQKAARTVLYEAFKHLLVAGNVLLHVLKDGSLKLYHLPHYVVKRDPAGNPIELVIREEISRMEVPQEAQMVLLKHDLDEAPKDASGDDCLDLFTRISLVDGQWQEFKELFGEKIPGTDATYPSDASPYLPLRLQRIDGQDYGYGYVDQYLGDLLSLEVLSKMLALGSAAAAKLLIFVSENGLTDKSAVAQAETGDVLDGDSKDVTSFQAEKSADFATAKAQADEITSRMKEAFMLMTPRQAERVTAEEIRALAQELEEGLGGIYSLFAHEMQLPLVRRLMLLMQREGKLPQLPKEAVQPSIVTGLAALSRDSDLQRLQSLAAQIANFDPAAIAQYLNVGTYLRLMAAALGLNADGLIRTDEQVQQMQQQAQMQELAKTALPHAIQAGQQQQPTEGASQ